DRPNDLSVGVAQCRCVERGGNNLTRSAPGIEARVAGNAALDYFTQRGGEFSRLLCAYEARQRLFDQLIGPEPKQSEYRVVRLEDFPFEVRNEYRVGSVFDEALCICARLIELTHIAQYAYGANHLPFDVSQRRRIQSRRDYLTRGTPRVQAGIAC